MRSTRAGRSIQGCWLIQSALVDPEALDDPAAHCLHGAVHRVIGLEDPAGFAPLASGPARHVEVLDVQGGGRAGVLVLGHDSEEADPDAIDDPAAVEVVPPPER